MEKRTELFGKENFDGAGKLEKEFPAQNAGTGLGMQQGDDGADKKGVTSICTVCPPT